MEGIVVGELGTILKTWNGGETWVDVGNYDPPLKSIEFASPFIGYAAGMGGTVTRTQDGGDSWSAGPPAGGDLFDISFADELTGYACGPAGFVAKTTDGGASWNQLINGVPQTLPLYCIDFPSGEVGYTGGGIWGWPSQGVMIKTIDGGLTWNQLPGLGNPYIAVMQFLTTTTGWVVYAWSHSGMKTINGGTTWTSFAIGNEYSLNSINDLYFPDEEHGFACGSYGEVYASEDGGLNWTPKGSTLREDLIDVAFTDNVTGFVAAQKALFRTNDGGSTWDSIFPDTAGSYYLQKAFFPSHETGFLSTYNKLWKTTDGGENWVQLPPSYATANMTDLWFTTPIDGFITGNNGHLWKTHDGGYSWTLETLDPLVQVNTLFFQNEWVGYVTCTGYSYYKTTDGGASWTRFTPTIQAGDMISFPDQMNGYIAGSYTAKKVIKTSDGGVSWSDVTAPGMNEVHDILFLSALNGYVFGNGTIFHTINGGNTWTTEVANNQIDFTAASMADDRIFTVGTVGTVMRRSDSIATGIGREYRPVDALALDCFPNPITDHLHITCRMSDASPVSLEVYSQQGLRIRSVDLGVHPAGDLSVDLPVAGLSPGVYLLVFTAGEDTAIKKIIRLP